MQMLGKISHSSNKIKHALIPNQMLSSLFWNRINTLLLLNALLVRQLSEQESEKKKTVLDKECLSGQAPPCWRLAGSAFHQWGENECVCTQPEWQPGVGTRRAATEVICQSLQSPTSPPPAEPGKHRSSLNPNGDRRLDETGQRGVGFIVMSALNSQELFFFLLHDVKQSTLRKHICFFFF